MNSVYILDITKTSKQSIIIGSINQKKGQKNQNSSFNVIATSHYKGPSAFATPLGVATPTLKTTALEHLHAIESERGQNLPVSHEKSGVSSI